MCNALDIIRFVMHVLSCTFCHARFVMHVLSCTFCHARFVMHVMLCTIIREFKCTDTVPS